ncbi:hypothetical protein A9Q84_06005 [Halobacteriovorax marinus]|uniref:Uncharacterized protein n=1 Tax=Halobacteriovorax marinus TaxID=97084 RepID=A0A1Y5F9D3_9BACT|nr:hypothetical protein A9Q84_06005 [Halobacteriovorax marinus]
MKILINRTDALGDTILTEPIAALLRKKFPEADIRFLVSPITIPLFENHPYVNGCFSYNKKLSFLAKIKRLRSIFKEFHPDIYLYAGGDHLPSYYSWFKRVGIRGGLVSKWPSFLFLNNGIRQKRSLVTMHESDYNLNLLKGIGIKYNSKERAEFAPKIHLEESKKLQGINDFKVTLKDAGLNSELPYIFIHPGMTGHTLNWSSRNYGRLIDKMELLHPNKYNWIISHTPADESYLVGIRDHVGNKEHLKDRFFFFDGSIKGLSNYMLVLSGASAFIGPSTGTTHIANTLEVPIVGIFSPIKVQSSLRWGPFIREKDKTRLVIPDVVCGERFKCAGASCPYYECMSKIEVQDIINELEDILSLEKK